MTIYFDFKINTRPGTELNCVAWHQQLPLLAVGSFINQSSRSYVTVFDQLGEPLSNLNELYEENNRINSLGWHPSKKILITGFSSGDMHLWNGQPDFLNVSSPHSTAIKFLKWSTLGTRLVSIDQSGILIGWKVDNNSSISRLFQINVSGTPISVDFCCGKPGLDVNVLAKKAVAGDEKALDMFSAWRPKTGAHRPTFSTDNVCFYLAISPNEIYYVDENGTAVNVMSCENEIQLILHHTKKEQLITILNDFSVNHYSTTCDGKLNIISKEDECATKEITASF